MVALHMKKYSTFALAIAFALLPQAAISQSGGEKAADACREAADETAMLKCRQMIVTQQAREMEGYRATLRKRADDDRKFRGLFDAAEKLWQQHRDADCAVTTYESANTRSADAYRLACVAKYNKIRIDYLKEMVDSP